MSHILHPRRYTKLLLILLVIALTGWVTLSGYSANEPTSSTTAGTGMTAKREQELARFFKTQEIVKLDVSAIARQVRESGRLSLVTQSGIFDLNLTPHDMRAPNYRAEEVTPNGVVRLVEAGAVRTYKGTVRGMEGAQARFTIDDEAMEGLIITRRQKYFIEPAVRYSPSANDKDYVFYKESDVIGRSLGRCGVTAAERVGAGVERVRSGSLQTPSAQSTAVHTEVITPKREVELQLTPTSNTSRRWAARPP